MTKKLFLAAASMALILGACSKNDDAPTFTQEITYRKAISVVYPLAQTSEEQGEASMAEYKVKYDIYAAGSGAASLAVKDLKVGGVATSFITTDLPMTSYGFSDKGYTYVMNVIDAKGDVLTGDNVNSVADLKVYITNGIYDLRLTAPGVTNDYGSDVGLYLHYDLNKKFLVKTFQRDTYYCGKTVTTYPSEEGMQAYENENINYRVVVDVEKSKADVVLYDAKFAAPAPALTGMVLRGLDVTYFNGGFQISGKDIVPEVMEGDNATTPNSRYTFNDFTLSSSSSDLIDVECSYTVATVFKGAFSGSAIRITGDRP